jgi:hypothetical protein
LVGISREDTDSEGCGCKAELRCSSEMIDTLFAA